MGKLRSEDIHRVVANCLINDIVVNETSIILLPSVDTWNDPKHVAIIKKASKFLTLGATVCAICGVTTALANFGLLDKRPHTSHGPEFLEVVSHGYKGQGFYIDKLSVADNNLVTASSTAALLWAKQMIEHLGVFQTNTLEFWYEFFCTGDPKHFFAFMQTLPSNDEN